MPFYYFPTYLLGGLLIYLGPAAWLLYLAVWRRLTLSYPRCAKCKYDLRTCWDQSQCPECGSDIQQRGAVLFTEKDMFIRKRPLILAVIWLAAPVILSIFSYAHSQVSGIQALPRTYTATLINNLSDPDNMDSPWYWHEFERREAKGELSNEELEKIFAVLIEDLKAKPINKRGPLSWSGKFVTNIIDSGLLSYPTVVTFFETYYGYPSHCDGFMIDRDSQVTRIELDFGHPWELSNNQFEPQGFLNKVTLLDDKPTEIAIEPQQDANSPIWNPGDPVPISFNFGVRNLKLHHILPEGEHILVFSFTCLYRKPLSNDLTQKRQLLATTQKDIRLKFLVNANGKIVQIDEQDIPTTNNNATPPGKPTQPPVKSSGS